jgi:hypothetical protein
MACGADLRASGRGTEQDEGSRLMRAAFLLAAPALALLGLLMLAGLLRAAN